jgi:secernin
MGGMIETYGQFGSGSPGKQHDKGSYDNAFIIADANEAWVLETAGRRWAARGVPHGCASISNEPSIRTQWQLGCPDLEAYARQRGWWVETLEFDFAQAYSDEKTTRQASHMRAMRSRQLLEERRGRVNAEWMKRIARDHYEDTFLKGPYFDAANPDFLSLCMHVSPADFTWGNTASSCVALLPRETSELPVLWWTPGPPCNGCYVPFFPHSSRLPEIVSTAGKLGRQVMPANLAGEDTFSSNSYWWLFRQLNDHVKGDALKSLPGCYPQRNPQVRARFDALELAFARQLPQVMEQAVIAGQRSPEQMSRILDEFSQACVNQVLGALKELTNP